MCRFIAAIKFEPIVRPVLLKNQQQQKVNPFILCNLKKEENFSRALCAIFLI